MILIMKKTSCLFGFAILVLCLFHSCRKTLSESQFNEFQITGPDGMVRSGGIYLPSGMKPDDRLPVIYMADGLAPVRIHFHSGTCCCIPPGRGYCACDGRSQ